jgi:hypothetical protein
MPDAQRNLILAGLVLILASSVGGIWYAFAVEHETLLLLREQYQAAFSAAAANDMTAALEALGEGQRENYRYVRMIDAHTHVIKLASLLMLVGLLVSVLGWNHRTRQGLAWLLAVGVVLFPLSVLSQIYISGPMFKLGAALGALMIIAFMIALVVQLFRQKTG